MATPDDPSAPESARVDSVLAAVRNPTKSGFLVGTIGAIDLSDHTLEGVRATMYVPADGETEFTLTFNGIAFRFTHAVPLQALAAALILPSAKISTDTVQGIMLNNKLTRSLSEFAFQDADGKPYWRGRCFPDTKETSAEVTARMEDAIAESLALSRKMRDMLEASSAAASAPPPTKATATAAAAESKAAEEDATLPPSV